jgi:hypothetical protein
MFVMMNAARLHVALQGIGLLEAAWRKAHAYAQERAQMRAPGAARGEGEADPIIRHPAVRRILDTERAWIDGLRLLAYRTGVELDVAKHHGDEARRARAQQWCSLVTPILKAMGTEQGFSGASRLLQVFGGHGYVKEWGIEQIVRDSRVAMIYEGTNEIQAIDLLVRKVLADGGAGLRAMLDGLAAELGDDAASAEVRRRFADLLEATEALAQAAREDAALPYEAADDYLRAAGLALLAWAWRKIERAPGASAPRWREPVEAARLRILPEFDMRLSILQRLCPQPSPQ